MDGPAAPPRRRPSTSGIRIYRPFCHPSPLTHAPHPSTPTQRQAAGPFFRKASPGSRAPRGKQHDQDAQGGAAAAQPNHSSRLATAKSTTTSCRGPTCKRRHDAVACPARGRLLGTGTYAVEWGGGGKGNIKFHHSPTHPAQTHRPPPASCYSRVWPRVPVQGGGSPRRRA